MKGAILIVVLLTNLNLFANPKDTTVTSFEIHLKRKSDNPLGFNTCRIDRQFVYDLVMNKLQKKISIQNPKSLHTPYVLMKFVDVCGRKAEGKEISDADRKALANIEYKYFIRICGNLDIDKPMNQHSSATFKLKIYVFDASGDLIAKAKSRSRENKLVVLTNSDNDENYPLSEKEFFDLVAEAADSIEITI